MERNPVSPKWHGIIDYGLVASLITLPTLLKMNSTARKIYLAEGLTLLGYLALTDHPTTIKPVIPFTTHGKIDPFNVAQFALQSFIKPFKNEKKTLIFNTIFAAVAFVEVALTDWHGATKKHPAA